MRQHRVEFIPFIVSVGDVLCDPDTNERRDIVAIDFVSKDNFSLKTISWAWWRYPAYLLQRMVRRDPYADKLSHRGWTRRRHEMWGRYIQS